jgi:hypothetical protein
VRKQCLLPLIQLKLQILLLLLSNRMSLIANMNLATLDHQIVSKYLAIHGRQITSNDLATKKSKSLAIKMMLVHIIKQCW